LASALLTASVFNADMKLSNVELALVDDPRDTIRFASIFFCGTAYYVFRDTIRYNNSLAIIAAIMLIGLLFNRTTEELAMPILGGYLIFWLAFLPATSASNSRSRGDGPCSHLGKPRKAVSVLVPLRSPIGFR
jgi:hypothetical protein